MLFNSLIFLLFASVFLLCMPLVNKLPRNLRLSFILSASLFFYGWWRWEFVFLLLFTGLVDFVGALAIQRWTKYKGAFLAASLLTNLGVLFYYKYALFFIQVWLDITGQNNALVETANVFIPIGLSFYTFQSMSYTIDVYRGRMEPTRNPLLFFSFISFFPHLVAGPIVRAREILPQLNRVRHTNELERYHGVKLMVIGFFKKTVIADHLGVFVNESFGAKEMAVGVNYWWLAVLAFTFQIYFDFSGYSDIARGLAKCLGIHFRMNFNHPYGAISFKQFWTRWHMSLSGWFRDYVYIALGGNKKGALRGHVNMWVTMLASGFWHGANYTYLIWGGLHAFYLSIERMIGFDKWSKKTFLTRFVALLLVFFSCSVAWIFFRAKDVNQAWNIVLQLMNVTQGFKGTTTDAHLNAVLFLKIAIVAEVLWIMGFRIRKLVSHNTYTVLELFYLAMLIVCCLFLRGPGEQFIYFQF